MLSVKQRSLEESKETASTIYGSRTEKLIDLTLCHDRFIEPSDLEKVHCNYLEARVLGNLSIS